MTEAEYVIQYRLAEDTLPRHKMTIFSVLIKAEAQLKTSEVAQETGYPTETARRYLQDLTAMGLVSRTAGGEGKADLWQLSPYCLDLLEKAAPNLEDLTLHPTPDVTGEVGDEDLTSSVGGE